MHEGRTLLVTTENDLRALVQVLERIAVLRIAFATINVSCDGDELNAAIEIRGYPQARLENLVARIGMMPCVSSAAAVPLVNAPNALPEARVHQRLECIAAADRVGDR